jgi:hypothetical protein
VLLTNTSTSPVCDPRQWLAEFKRSGIIRDRAAILLGSDRLGDPLLLREVSAQPQIDLKQLFLFAFSCVALGSQIGVFARLYAQLPLGWSLRRYFAHLYKEAELPPLRQTEAENFRARIEQFTGWDAVRWETDGRLVPLSAILSAAVQLREAVRLARAACEPIRDRLAVLSGTTVEIGDFVASSTLALTLDWADAVLHVIFEQAGFESCVPGVVLSEGEDTDAVFTSMERACKLLEPLTARPFMDRLLAELEIEVGKVKTSGAMTTVAAIPATEGGPQSVVPTNRFVLDCGNWYLQFGSEKWRFDERKFSGMRYINALLSRPDQSIPALELSRLNHLAPTNARSILPDREVGEVLGRSLQEPGCHSSGGRTIQEPLDKEAKAAVQARMQVLASEIEKARQEADSLVLADLQKEWDDLTEQLEAQRGFKGRPKEIGPASDATKSRQAVRRAIDRACERIREVMPALGEHFRNRFRVDGNAFRYLSDSAVGGWET